MDTRKLTAVMTNIRVDYVDKPNLLVIHVDTIMGKKENDHSLYIHVQEVTYLFN